VTVKEKLQENGLISGKSDVSLLMLQFQKYKFVDILYTDIPNSNEYPVMIYRYLES